MNSIDVSSEIYDAIVLTQKYNGTPTAENIIGSRKTLMVKTRKLASIKPEMTLNLGTLPKEKFAPFLGLFTKTLYKSLKNNPDLQKTKIHPPKASTIASNHLYWNNIPVGTYFYNIDFKSAYWQFAHKIGYIDNKTYLRYMPDDNYKEAKRLCISFLARVNYTKYYNKNGELTHTITCDTSILSQAYENIRNAMYLLIQDGISNTDQWISYNQDSISVELSQTNKVMAIFNSAGIEFKKNLCQKISQNQYTHGFKVKNFR